MLDKSIISQFDSISQYTYFLEQKQQAEDEKSQKFNGSNNKVKDQFSASDGFQKLKARRAIACAQELRNSSSSEMLTTFKNSAQSKTFSAEIMKDPRGSSEV